MTTTTIPELKAKLPSVLHVLVDRPDLRKYLLPDIAVSTDAARTDCMHVTFSVTWTPGVIDALLVHDRAVDVLVWDEYGTLPVLRTYTINGGGQTVTDSVELPLPPDAHFDPDYKRRFFIAADPFGRIGEMREKNNAATIVGTCVG